SGLSTSYIRFYEAKGLLNAVSRKANGYREYPPGTLMILGIIAGAQRTGFSLDEIKQILPADLSNWRHGELMGALRRKAQGPAPPGSQPQPFHQHVAQGALC